MTKEKSISVLGNIGVISGSKGTDTFEGDNTIKEENVRTLNSNGLK